MARKLITVETCCNPTNGAMRAMDIIRKTEPEAEYDLVVEKTTYRIGLSTVSKGGDVELSMIFSYDDKKVA